MGEGRRRAALKPIVGPDRRRAEADRRTRPAPQNEAAAVSRFGANTPMQCLVQPVEAGPASHSSSYIAGEILPVIDGY
jgi:hypothetical protein